MIIICLQKFAVGHTEFHEAAIDPASYKDYINGVIQLFLYNSAVSQRLKLKKL